ncbi:MAG: efflux RND transporter periplasmic adaptor subunit [Myxococcota bacterium]
MTSTHRFAAAAALAACAALALGRTGRAGDDDPPATDALPVATVRVALRAGFEVRERLAGRVVSPRRSELGFERGGRVAEVAVDDGERVAAGDVLARLDTRELAAQRRELEARVAATDARLELARATSERQRELRRADFASQQRLDEAVAGEKALAAQIAADRASLERVRVALELSLLRAPYDALVAARHLDEGTVAQPGQAVLSILERDAREVRVGVPPDVATRLEPGRRYAVEIDGQGDVIEAGATLRRVVAAIDVATRTQTAVLALDADAPPVPDGALARVLFEREVAAPGAWVPIGALAEAQRGTWTAYAVVRDADGAQRAERRQVEVLHGESDRAYVRGTLRDGDELVADGLHRLAPGLRVRVASTSTFPAASSDAARAPGAPPPTARPEPPEPPEAPRS